MCHRQLPPPQIILPWGKFKFSSNHWLFLMTRTCPNSSTCFLADAGLPSTVSIKLCPGMAISSPGVCVRQLGSLWLQLCVAQVLCQPSSSKGSALVMVSPTGAQWPGYFTHLYPPPTPRLSASFSSVGSPLQFLWCALHVYLLCCFIPSFLPNRLKMDLEYQSTFQFYS